MINLKSTSLIAVLAIGLFSSPSLADSDSDYRNCVYKVKTWIDRKGNVASSRVQQLAESYCQRTLNEVKEDCLNSAYRQGFADSKKTNSGAIEFAINQCQLPSYYVPPVN